MKNQMKTGVEVKEVVEAFYEKVRKHEKLGPIFNSIVEDWPKHLNHITNFWMANLHQAPTYKGFPGRVHIEVDYKTDHVITQEYFGHWLQLWFETIDEKCEGEFAHLAKERARNMAFNFFMKMFRARKQS